MCVMPWSAMALRRAGRSVTSPCTNVTFCDFGFRQDEPEPPRVFLEVEHPDLIAAGEQVADDPGPDEAIAAGDQDAHGVLLVAPAFLPMDVFPEEHGQKCPCRG